MQNFRLALRQFAKNPGFAAVAILTLAVGIGANTAMFSFVNAILLRPLPYPEPDRLVMLFENHATNGWNKVSIGAPVLAEWRRQATLFDGIGAARGYGNFTLTGKGAPETLRGSSYSANIFPLLGVQPIIGRSFLPEEETHGKHLVVLLSHEFWQRRFGGQTNILGQSLTLAGEPYTVIGVMPPKTAGPTGKRDVWTPLAFKSYEMEQRHAHNFAAFGRLKQGVSLEQARTEMSLIAKRMGEADEQNRGWGAEAYSLKEIVVGDSQQLLVVLLCSVGMVLLIACANIAGLLLARSVARTREFAIRAALGAGRGAMIRQLLAESLLLAGAGGALGLFVARLGIETLLRASPPDLPRMDEGIPLDGTTLAFTALITFATGVAFGLMPAWQSSNPELARDLAESSRGTGGNRRHTARAALVVVEAALSLVLLAGAGLMIRSFSRLLDQNLGYVPESVSTMLIGLPEQKYADSAARRKIFDPLLEAVRNIPGVDSASYAFGLPLSGINSSLSVTVQGAPPPAPGESVAAGYAQVSPGHFATMKTPLVQGRDFTAQDDTNAPAVLIVDEMFVRNFKLGPNPIGRKINVGDGTENAEIVGVVKDVKRTGMADRPQGEMYRPYRQNCWGVLTLVVRSQRSPSDITGAIRSELDRLDADVPLENVRTMTQLVESNVAQRRLSVRLLGGFAAVALLLSAMGLYGVLSNMVAQRTREIGIRVALGARQRDVLSLIVRQGMRMALLGTAIGLCGALALSQLLRQLLFEVNPFDPPTFIVVPLVLITVALFACWLPARRAARVDPMEALRNEG